jgi:hypothetical protein
MEESQFGFEFPFLCPLDLLEHISNYLILSKKQGAKEKREGEEGDSGEEGVVWEIGVEGQREEENKGYFSHKKCHCGWDHFPILPQY